MNIFFQWATAILMGSCIGLSAVGAQAATVLEKVAQTGKLVAGTRTDSIPFAYKNADGQWVGYSIDLLERIRAQLEQQLQRPVELELVEVNSASRISVVTEGEVDIVCGSTSFTRSRDLDVDFSVGYFVTGAQLLIKTTSGLGSELSIGVVEGTTSQQLMERIFPVAQFVNFGSRSIGLLALERERIDALAGDGILLEAMRQTLPDAENYEVFPDQPYDQEAYACMLPENQLEFQRAVNTGLLEFMQGVLAGRPTDVEVIDTWFGVNGVVPIEQQSLLNFFQRQVSTYANLLGETSTQ